MQIIHKYDSELYTFVGLQPVRLISYRKCLYSHSVPVDDGVLLYHTYTREIVLLTELEYEMYIQDSLSVEYYELRQYLITHWFLVPIEFDEYNFYLNTSEVYRKTKRTELTTYRDTFVIYTTTACNAQCNYCFERNMETKTMGNQTALNVAKYIVDNSHGKPIKIRWFGGEPLINPEPMRIIGNYLNQHDIKWFSSLITNGYCLNNFDKNFFKDVCKIGLIQVTLDGMKDTYNRIKNYANGDDNAFGTIINNIKYIVNLGLNIQIRFNLSDTNFNELMELVDYLATQLPTNSNKIRMNINALYDCEDVNKTEKMWNKTYKEYRALLLHIREKFPMIKQSLYNLNPYQCMKDNPAAVGIFPDGGLCLCEHDDFGDSIGTIYQNDIDITKLHTRYIRANQSADCNRCVCYPQCYLLKGCTAAVPCHSEMRANKQLMLELQAKDYYSDYKRNNVINHDMTVYMHHLMCYMHS